MGKIFRKIIRKNPPSNTEKVIEEEPKEVDKGPGSTYERRNSALEAARQRKKEMTDAGIADVRKNPVERWEEDKGSIRKSVNAKCFQCNGEENYRNRTKFCNVFDCALWHVRPYGRDTTVEQCRSYRED